LIHFYKRNKCELFEAVVREIKAKLKKRR